MKEYVDMFKALSDETRLRIVILLSKKELCVCQIEASLVLSQAKVSRHLAVLRHAGLVNVRRDGLWMHYSLIVPRNKLEAKIFACFREFLRKEVFFKKDLMSVKKCTPKPLLNVTKKW
jgi:ArsR family transcriptional regulator